MRSDDVPTHRLDPRVISYDRLVNGIVAAGLAFGLLVALVITLAASGAPRDLWFGAPVAWLAAALALARWARRWPGLSYQYASYVVTDRHIAIRRGVYWRRVVVVPRSRVQHIDVSQGPLQRSYGLATLTIFTAGTAYSNVPLAGLSHGTALALRDALLPTRSDDGA